MMATLATQFWQFTINLSMTPLHLLFVLTLEAENELLRNLLINPLFLEVLKGGVKTILLMISRLKLIAHRN